MPRFIDADALLETEPEVCADYGEEYGSEFGYSRDQIANAPTISHDEVCGVVRCQDCKWCHAGYCEKYDDLIPWGCASKPWVDWFCADGEKMEASEDD